MVQPSKQVPQSQLDTLYSQYLDSSADKSKSTERLVALLEELSMEDSKPWLTSHNKERLSLLQQLPNLAPQMISDRVCKVYQTLLQGDSGFIEPSSGQLVSVYILDNKLPVMQIPRNLLIAQSKVFAAQLTEGFKLNPLEHNQIHLREGDVELLKHFIGFLSTGTISISGENVLQLHALADFYACSGLHAACEKFLLQNAKKEDLPNLLRYAVRINRPSIMAICKIIIWDNQEEIRAQIQQLPLDMLGLEDWQQQLLLLVKALPKLPDKWEFQRGRLTLSDVKESKLWKHIPELKNWGLYALDFREKKAGASLESICVKIQEHGLHNQITELLVNLSDITINDLKALQKIPSLKGFANRAYHPKGSKELESYLKTLADTMKLTPLGLDLRKLSDSTDDMVKRLFARCPDMRFFMIKSDKIQALDCKESLLELNCSDCPNLTLLQAPNALQISCRYCFQLKEILAPKAKQIDSRDCPLLPNRS